jgi:hypothetical protein
MMFLYPMRGGEMAPNYPPLARPMHAVIVH